MSNAKDLLALSNGRLDGEHLLLHDFGFLRLKDDIKRAHEYKQDTSKV